MMVMFTNLKCIQVKYFGRELCSKSWFDRQCCYQLTDWLQGKYHKVIFDIFFSSVPLLKELKRKNILAYGTTREDLPVIADEKSLERGDFDLKKVTITCPQVVKDYHHNMGGVDKHDMLRQLYEINRKSMKYWHRLLFGSLVTAVVNT